MNGTTSDGPKALAARDGNGDSYGATTMRWQQAPSARRLQSAALTGQRRADQAGHPSASSSHRNARVDEADSKRTFQLIA